MNEEFDLEEFAPWLVVAITAVGGFLRLILLGAKGMWLDETFSVWMASHSVGEMLQWIVKIDQHPPLYYLLLHTWIALNGDTPYYVRLLSVLFGAATIPIIYLIGKRISGVVMGLVAAIFLALSLFNIYFAQETRMYTLLTFNAAVAIYALVRLLTDGRVAKPIGSQFREYWYELRGARPIEPAHNAECGYQDGTLYQSGWRSWIYRHRWNSIHAVETDLAWVAFIVFSAATLLSHNTAVLFPVTTNLFVLALILVQWKSKPVTQLAFHAPSLSNWVKAQIAILLLWSPWLVPFVKQASTVYQRFWIPTPTWELVIQVLTSLLNPSASVSTGLTSAIWTLYLLVLALGAVHFRKRISGFGLLAALFVIPFLAELLVSLWRPIFWGRTLIWTTIPLLLILAAGVAQLKFRPLMLLVLGSLVALNLFSIADYYRFFQKEDWRTAAGYVANFAEKDDLVLFNSNFVVIPFDYYFKPFEKQYSLQIVREGVPLDLFESGILEPEMTESDIPSLTSLLREHNRVWLVYSHDSYTDPRGLIPQTFAAQKKLIRQRDFYGGQVQLYGNP
ncbi:MAG: glycosyltransferase family 39 protein [Caldilineaceae bacterium]